MNRNVESRFAEIPSVDIQRSIFDRSSTHKTSFNVGELIPFYIDEVLPGDSFQVTTSKVCRLQTLLTPVMDNLYLDTYFFFVPNRIVWSHWKEFQGENSSSAWVPAVEYQIPSISSPAGGFATGTIADYLGLPVGVEWTNSDSRRPSALPFRAYALICNEFFRDENLTDPLNIPLGDANQTGSNGDNYLVDVANGGKPFKVAKYHDYFTSCLPGPQKATDPVSVPLPSFQGGTYPVLTSPNAVPFSEFNNIPYASYGKLYSNTAGMQDWTSMPAQPSVNTFSWNRDIAMIHSSNPSTGISSPLVDGEAYEFPANLAVTIPGSESGSFSINELRLAFQLQKYYEKLARGGSRYFEVLKQMFGVTSPDARLQRPEYLGGNRIPITVHEVLNNAQGEKDFLGDLGAMSITADVHEDFSHSFVEHGYVIGVCCLRYDHSYPQGLERFWSRREVTDFYLPVFANIGEQPVYASEICATSQNIADASIFGFQECWADYRYKPNRVSAEMRPGITNTLASWHFADYYSTPPTLSDGWIREDKSNVDRTLAVTSAVSNQAFADFYVKNICTRCMPTYSIPGLIDHH